MIFWGGLFLNLFLSNGFNSTILQSVRNIEYFIDKLQICEMVLAKTVIISFKNLPDMLSRPAILYSFLSLKSSNTVCSDTKVYLNLEWGTFIIFSWFCVVKVNQISKEKRQISI